MALHGCLRARRAVGTERVQAVGDPAFIRDPTIRARRMPISVRYTWLRMLIPQRHPGSRVAWRFRWTRVAALAMVAPLVLTACRSQQPAGNQTSNRAAGTTPSNADNLVLQPLEKIDRVVLSSGLVIEDLKRGTGAVCLPNSTIVAKYTCTIQGSTRPFDSTGNDAFDFDLRSMIRGWRDGLPGMQVGGVRRITVPPELGYGPRELKDESGAVLAPANSTLVYEVELVGVK